MFSYSCVPQGSSLTTPCILSFVLCLSWVWVFTSQLFLSSFPEHDSGGVEHPRRDTFCLEIFLGLLFTIESLPFCLIFISVSEEIYSSYLLTSSKVGHFVQFLSPTYFYLWVFQERFKSPDSLFKATHSCLRNPYSFCFISCFCFSSHHQFSSFLTLCFLII